MSRDAVEDEEKPIPEGTLCIYCKKRPATIRGKMTVEGVDEPPQTITVDLLVCRPCGLAIIVGKNSE